MKVDKKVRNCRPTSELAWNDRPDKVNQTKRNSTCRKRGKTGNWAGDEACLQRNQYDDKDKGKRKGKGKGKCTKFKSRIGMHQRPLPTLEFSATEGQCLESKLGPRTRGHLDQKGFGDEGRSIVYHDAVR